MRILQNLFEQDWLRGVLYTIIAMGLIATLFGGWRLVATEFELRDNMAYQRRNDEITIETPTEQQLLFLSDMERRQLQRDRWSGMIVTGAGLVVLSVGWMGLNVSNALRDKKPDVVQSA